MKPWIHIWDLFPLIFRLRGLTFKINDRDLSYSGLSMPKLADIVDVRATAPAEGFEWCRCAAVIKKSILAA